MYRVKPEMIHHQKHHKSYVENLASAQKEIHWAIIQGQYSKIVSLNNTIAFNAGAHTNHSIFWKNLSPRKCVQSKELRIAIRKNFGCFCNLKKRMGALANSVYGSGWVWLAYNKNLQILQLAVTANQDPLEATTGLIPLFGIDVWEHAYYLQYKNSRVSYVEALFDIANWKDISERYRLATK